VKRRFRAVTMHVVLAESELFTHMGMLAGAKERDYGLADHQTAVVIDSDQSHPIASGRSDHVKICQREGLLAWGKPRKAESLIASLTDHPDRAAIFAYEQGDQMYGLAAPARRVGIFLTQEFASVMEDSDAGWELFDAAVKWAASQGPNQLSCVLRLERKEIQLRRERQGYSPSVGASSSSPPADLVGLALSGGGIRSATFSLGFLQGLQRVGLLRIFDYLSTVSGGGYAGGWWSAWLGREALFTENDGKNAHRFVEFLQTDEKPLSQCLWNKYLQETNLLCKGSNGRTTEYRLRAALVNDLNNLIQPEADFSWKEHLPKETLSGRSQELLNRRLTRKGRILLKRLLLEDAYPAHLARSIFPPPEKVVPQRILDLREATPAQQKGHEEIAPDVLSAGHDPAHYLRLFANFLTPRKGLLSADTWRAITFISRN